MSFCCLVQALRFGADLLDEAAADASMAVAASRVTATAESACKAFREAETKLEQLYIAAASLCRCAVPIYFICTQLFLRGYSSEKLNCNAVDRQQQPQQGLEEETSSDLPKFPCSASSF